MPGQRPDSWSIRCARLHTAPPLRGRGKGGQSPLNPTPNPAEIRWSAFSRFSGLSPYPKGGGACAAPQGLSRSIIQPGSSFWRGGRPNKARSWSRSRYASIAAMSRSSGHSLLFTLAKIMAPEWFDGLKRAAEGRRLMVLDTLRRFHIEEENASGPMAQVIGRMEAIAADTGCSIVFLHHASKGAAMMGAGDQQQASRGSSVLVDNIRWQSYLSSMTSAEAEEWGVDDDQRRFFVRFGVSKANYGAPFADRWFRRHDGGVLKPAVLERQRKSKGVPRGEA